MKIAMPIVRHKDPELYCFADDGFVPNHPKWPLALYRQAVDLNGIKDPGFAFEQLFALNGWGRSWQNGIYPYTHYHSQMHEVLGIVRGHVEVQFGGDRGQAIAVHAGDVAILPAGTGHRRLAASDNYLVVGAYPPQGTYDECTSEADHAAAVISIRKVPRPLIHPIFGVQTFASIWKK